MRRKKAVHLMGALAAAALLVNAPRSDASTCSPQIGVHVGLEPAALTAFEAWLGRRVDGVRVATGEADWRDYDNSIAWLADRWRGADRRIYWSIPLIPRGADLAQAANGAYDDHYRNAARQLLRTRRSAEPIYVRTGWEFNGAWMTWYALGRERAFIGAYRRFVNAFRAQSRDFLFEWTPNIGGDMDPAAAYPGDAYVDVIGMDFYYNSEWDNADTAAAWRYMVARPYGLDWHRRFAAAHRKPIAYSEWGIDAPGGGAYIEAAKNWFEAANVHYHIYWNTDEDRVDAPNAGARGEAFRRVFGRSDRRPHCTGA